MTRQVATSAIVWGGTGRAPTPAEAVFAAELHRRLPGLQYWLHADADGTPWLLVSLDIVKNGGVQDTLRLDFDAAGICGGWSPSALNWDDGVRAAAVGIDRHAKDGMQYGSGHSPAQLAAFAADWFKAKSLL